VDWRIAHGSRWILGYTLFGLGAFMSGLNCYWRLVRPVLHRLRGGSPMELRNISSAPLLGMLTVAGLALAPASLILSTACIVLVAIDTGNIVWGTANVWGDASLWAGDRRDGS
jgi:hypothetical protein